MIQSDSNIPVNKYGVHLQDEALSELHDIAEQVKRLGYAILDAEFTKDEKMLISSGFDNTRSNYVKKYNESRLRSAGAR